MSADTEGGWDWRNVDAPYAYVDGTPPDFVLSDAFETIKRCADDYWSWLRPNGCLAATNRGSRCTRRVDRGLPFCWQHGRLVHASFSETEAQRSRSDHLDQRERAIAKREIDVTLRERDVPQQSFVYFYEVGEYVKIGKSTNPDQRVLQFKGRTANPPDVDVTNGSILGVVRGGLERESYLHHRFSGHRVVGEWFDMPPIRKKILRLIAEEEAQTAGYSAP